MSLELAFFQFLFSGYFRSIATHVSIVSGGSNQSSSEIFCISMSQLCLQGKQVLLLLLFLTYSQSTSPRGCKALCMVINFFLLWSICLNSSLVHSMNGPKYLMMETAQVFTTLIRFLLCSFISSRFLVLMRYPIFASFPLV